jgi:hypothetical protein
MIPRPLSSLLALPHGVLSHYPSCLLSLHIFHYYLSLSLRSGHADGSGALARCYYSGRGVPKDDGMALSLASSSAEFGSAYGQYVLGAIHFNGDCGLEPNDQRAFFLWDQAAKQGHISSADWLSVLCVMIYLMPCVMSKNSIPPSGTPKAGEFSRTFLRCLFRSFVLNTLTPLSRVGRHWSAMLSQLPPGFLGPSSSLIHSDHVRHLPRHNFLIRRLQNDSSSRSKACAIQQQHLNKSYEKNFYHFIQKQWQPVSESIQTEFFGHCLHENPSR